MSAISNYALLCLHHDVFFFAISSWHIFVIRNAFKHELELLEKVRHPNVVQFVGAVTQNIPMMIVAEYHPKVITILSITSFSFSCLLFC